MIVASLCADFMELQNDVSVFRPLTIWIATETTAMTLAAPERPSMLC